MARLPRLLTLTIGLALLAGCPAEQKGTAKAPPKAAKAPPKAAATSKPAAPASKPAAAEPDKAAQSAVPADWLACKADTDCAIVQVGCCDHCNGGQALAVAMGKEASATEKYKEKGCSGACTERACDQVAGKCVDGKCCVVRTGIDKDKPPVCDGWSTWIGKARF